MKYTIAVLSGIEDDNVIEKEISVRVDARLETVVRKAAEEIGMVLEKKGLLARPARYWADMPNVWRNGAVGTLCVQDDKRNYFIGIRRSDSKAWMFM